jgi:diguanylate cyclase (GGDEF)-like protein/PAS domain S-box-containing protein
MRETFISLQHMQTNEKDFLVNLVAFCPDGVIAVNRSGIITIFNRAAEVLTGHSAETTIGCMNIIDIYPSSRMAKKIKQLIYSDTRGDKGCLEGHEVEIITQAGRKVPIRLSAVLIYDNGEEIGSVGFFHDLSRQKKMEKKLLRLSVTDDLTCLFNHRHFYTNLSKEIGRASRYKRPLSLICFDLDNFKACNDQLGHLEGDNILRIVGRLLLDIVRKSDTAYRYGGDEFFVLLPETGLPNAMQTAEKLRASVNAHWPYEVAHKEIDLTPVTISVGVAQWKENETAEAVIKRADAAMYEAKRQGGDRVMANTT